MPTPPNETIELRAQQLDRTPNLLKQKLSRVGLEWVKLVVSR